MICEEKFLWKQLGEGMLLRAFSPSSPWPASPRAPGVWAAHGHSSCLLFCRPRGWGKTEKWGNFLLPQVASCSRGELGQSRETALREAPGPQESVGSVTGAKEEEGHRPSDSRDVVDDRD